MKFTPRTRCFAISIISFALSHAAFAEEKASEKNETATEPKTETSTVIVTGVKEHQPLMIETDTKAPRQPLPAHDGADYLKTIPGFSVTRKGGADGDASFRGMAGSRLGILIDGENVLGGCNYRMDAPTAYIYPEVYDTLTVIKGPQSVQYGAGNSAATILFERNIKPFAEPGYRLHASALAGSFGRFDEMADLQLGNSLGYLQLNGTDSRSDDYQNGAGNDVHSEYHRYSGNIALGWTPTDFTKLEISAARSDGEAAYADRGMDGTKFLRESFNIRAEQKFINDVVEEVKFHWYDNSVDHIMDDQELRKPGMMGYANLARDTDGGRLATTLRVGKAAKVTLGIDAQNTAHMSRSAPISGKYSSWIDDAEFNQQGVFGELIYTLNTTNKIISGLRIDQWEATDQRAMISMGMMSMKPNPHANDTRRENLESGFARYEHLLADSPTTLYAGFGHSERFPDYWEMIAKESMTSISAFNIKAEATNQLDLGVLYKTNTIDVTASAFYNKVDNFILADYSSMMKMSGASINVDATTYGAEFGLGYILNENWKTESSLAYVHGQNDTNNKPLPQLSPLEARLGLTYSSNKWTIGGLVRGVAAQTRFDINKGNIVGKDLGVSSGFAVFSLNSSYKFNANTLLSAGADNLFDRDYAEFISRSSGNGMGGSIPGYLQSMRVNEPGRTLWLKLQVSIN